MNESETRAEYIDPKFKASGLPENYPRCTRLFIGGRWKIL